MTIESTRKYYPTEVGDFFAEHGFKKIGLYAAEGITIGIQESLHELAENDPETYKAALAVIIETADDPSILGMAAHLLYIGRKERFSL